jgi:hypothetical protein
MLTHTTLHLLLAPEIESGGGMADHCVSQQQQQQQKAQQRMLQSSKSKSSFKSRLSLEYMGKRLPIFLSLFYAP